MSLSIEQKQKRAYSKGYRAGIKGRSQIQCPHEVNNVKAAWLRGWRVGREDHTSGCPGYHFTE